MPVPTTPPASRTRCRTLLTLVVAALIGMGIASAPTTAPPAEAAVVGRMIAFGGWSIGAFLSSTGHYVYCIEPGAVEPSGAQATAQRVSALPAYSGSTFDQTGWNGPVASDGLSGTKLRQINYVLSRYGATSDAGTAAAVQFAIWILRADPGAQAWLNHHIAWVRAHGGASHIDQANAMANEARSSAGAPVRPQPAALELEQHDPDGSHEHTGIVRFPAGTTSVKLVGARFADGSTSIEVTDGAAGSAEWRATVFEDAWTGLHAVDAVSTWRLSATGWPAEVVVHPPVVPGQQRLVSAAGHVTVPFDGAQEAGIVVNAQFSPVLSTRVSERFLGSQTDAFGDSVMLSAAEGSLPWPSRTTAAEHGGSLVEYAPITATGVVYGPFDAPQPEAPEPPDGAPEAGRAELIAQDGPGEYEIMSDSAPLGPGYYYWVWHIRETEQPEPIRTGHLLPEQYEFGDAFGLVDEGHIVPTALRWDTRLQQHTLELDELVLRDTVTARAEGDVWLRDEHGERIPANIRLTVYESAQRPERSAQAPGHARELTHEIVRVEAPDVGVISAPIMLPESTRGWVSVQACLFDDDQPDEWQGHFEEWCDDYGIPAETARINMPLLSTTGSGADSWSAGVPFMGIALVSVGAAALLIGGAIRARRSTRRLHAGNANQIHRL